MNRKHLATSATLSILWVALLLGTGVPDPAALNEIHAPVAPIFEPHATRGAHVPVPAMPRPRAPLPLSATWNEIGGRYVLPALADAAMAEQPAYGGIVLFGGENVSADTALNLTGLYANETWENLTPFLASSPSPRWGETLTWDPAASQLVLFGGQNQSDSFNDTWTLNRSDLTDGSGWHRLTTIVAPSPRSFSSAFYDPTTSGIILFGGACETCSGATVPTFNDTWEFSSGNWTNLTSALSPGPSALEGAFSAWDPDLGGGILFGGAGPGSPGSCADSNETWLYHSGWTQLVTNGTPGNLSEGQLSWYPAGDEMVLLGGVTPSPTGCQGTNQTSWMLQGYDWTNITLSSGAVYGIDPIAGEAMGYDPFNQLVVAYGGDAASSVSFENTWTFPTTDLTASVRTNYSKAEVGYRAGFYSSVTGGQAPFSYEWSYGDGSPNGTGVDAYPIYTSKGVYNVTLRVTDPAGRSANATPIVITVVAPLQIVASSSPLTGNVPFTVRFNSSAAEGVGPYYFSWNFGDHTNSSSANNTHLYRLGGVFTANLSVTDSINISRNASFRVTVIGRLVASITPSALAAVAPATINFSADLAGGLSPFSYSWTFAAGATATGPSASYTFEAPGSYNVTVQVTDAANQTTTGFVVVNVYAPLTSSAQVSAPLSLAPTTESFTSKTAGGDPPLFYTWNFGDGSPSVPGISTTHQYEVGGNYTATLVVTDALSERTTNLVPVEIVTPLKVGLNASLTQGPTPLLVAFTPSLSGGLTPFSYAWQFGDGSSGTGQFPTHTYSPGNYTATVWVTDAASENQSASIRILAYVGLAVTVRANPANFTIGNVTSLTATLVGGVPPTTVRWLGLPTGCLSSNSLHIDCLPTSQGNFDVEVVASDTEHENVSGFVALHVLPVSSGSPGPGPSAGGFSPTDTVALVLVVVAGIAAVAFLLWRGRRLRRTAEAPADQSTA